MGAFQQNCGQNHIWSFGRAYVDYVPVKRNDSDRDWCGTVEYFDFLGQCWYILARFLSVLGLILKSHYSSQKPRSQWTHCPETCYSGSNAVREKCFYL